MLCSLRHLFHMLEGQRLVEWWSAGRGGGAHCRRAKRSGFVACPMRRQNFDIAGEESREAWAAPTQKKRRALDGAQRIASASLAPRSTAFAAGQAAEPLAIDIDVGHTDGRKLQGGPPELRLKSWIVAIARDGNRPCEANGGYAVRQCY